MSGNGVDALGIYSPGRSILHRMPAGTKLAVLFLGSLVLAVWRGLPALAVAAVVVLAAYLLARISARAAWIQLRPLRWLVPVLFVAQLAFSGWRPAVGVVGALVVLVAAAALVTLTTRVTDMVETFVRIARPLRLVGVDPERVGLLAALTLRTIPVISGLAEEVRQARRARGRERSLRAFLVQFVVRTVRHADHLGEALIARGVDD